MEALHDVISRGPGAGGTTNGADQSTRSADLQNPPGRELVQVTNAMVRLHKDLFGRGPTKARSAYAGPDTLVTTLEDGYTAAERNLIAIGERQLVRDRRTLFRQVSERRFVEAVERITGRSVRALVSGTDGLGEVSAEIVYFEPAGDEATKDR